MSHNSPHCDTLGNFLHGLKLDVQAVFTLPAGAIDFVADQVLEIVIHHAYLGMNLDFLLRHQNFGNFRFAPDAPPIAPLNSNTI